MSSPVASPAPHSETASWARPLTWLLTVIGLLGGVAGAVRHVTETDFPIDMIIYLEGVRAFLSGGEMYAVPMYAGDIALPFIYPPFGALILAPFVWLGVSNELAGDIMIVASDLLVLLCLAFVLRAVMPNIARPIRLAVAALVWALTMSFEPVTLNNGFAQINIVIMALVVLDLVPRRRLRFLPQGWLTGVAAAIKLSPLAMGLYFLVRRDWKAILVAGISAIACTAVAALWRMDATIEFYLSTLLGMGSGENIGVDTTYQSNSSIKGMLMRWATSAESMEANSTLINVVWLALALVTIVLGGWLMLALFRRGMDVDAMLVNAMVMLLISPISWSHHWVWLTIILPVFAWRSLTVLKHGWFLGSVVGVWTLLLVTNPPKWWFGNEIDIYVLNGVQKFLVSDFVWLAVLTMIALAVGLRGVDKQSVDKNGTNKKGAGKLADANL